MRLFTVKVQSGFILDLRSIDVSMVQIVCENGHTKNKWSRVSFGSPHSKKDYVSPHYRIRSLIDNLFRNTNHNMKAYLGINWGKQPIRCQETAWWAGRISSQVHFVENLFSYISFSCSQSIWSWPSLVVGIGACLICFIIYWRWRPRVRLTLQLFPFAASATLVFLLTPNILVPASPVLLIKGPTLNQLSNQNEVDCPSLTSDLRNFAAIGRKLSNFFHIHESLVVFVEMFQKDESRRR